MRAIVRARPLLSVGFVVLRMWPFQQTARGFGHLGSEQKALTLATYTPRQTGGVAVKSVWMANWRVNMRSGDGKRCCKFVIKSWRCEACDLAAADVKIRARWSGLAHHFLHPKKSLERCTVNAEKVLYWLPLA